MHQVNALMTLVIYKYINKPSERVDISRQTNNSSQNIPETVCAPVQNHWVL